MKNKEQILLKINAKSINKAIVFSTLTLTLLSSSLPSIAYAIETEEIMGSNLDTTSAELETEKPPILTEGIPVISTDEVDSGVSEKEAPTKEAIQVIPEEGSKGITEEIREDSTDVAVKDSSLDDEIAEISTEQQFVDAIQNKSQRLKLIRSINLSSNTPIIKHNMSIDLNGLIINTGNFTINTSKNDISFENGRINGGFNNGHIASQLSEVTFKNMVFTGYLISGSYEGVPSNSTVILEGNVDIRTSNGIGNVGNIVVKENAIVSVAVGYIVFSNESNSGYFTIEDNAELHIKSQAQISYLRILEIGENSIFIARNNLSNGLFNSSDFFSIDAKKNSTFDVKSSYVFGVNQVSMNFENLNNLNIESTQNYYYNPFQTNALNYMRIIDTELNIWQSSDITTPSYIWDIKGLFEISNFNGASPGYVYSHNSLVEAEYLTNVGTNYYRISNGASTAKPIILGVSKKVTIPVGTEFKPLDGISANDRIDGDLTNQVKWKETSGKTIDTSMPGKYTIQYSVKNSNQRETTATTELTIEEKKISKTTISDLNTTSKTVKGNGEPNAPIDIVVNEKIISSGNVNSDGYYTLEIPIQSMGTNVTARVSAFNQVSEASTTVKSGELAKTTISDITTTSTIVSGTGEPNGEINVFGNNQKLTSGRIGSDGIYNLTIPKQLQGVTVLVKVSLNGLESQATTVVLKAKEELFAPIINDYYTTNVNATGTIEGSAKQVAIYVNGIQRRTAAVVNGNYVIYTGDLGLTTGGQSFQIAGLFNGLEGPKTTAVVQTESQLLAPRIDDYYTTNANATGSIAGSAKQVAVFVDGVQKRTAAVTNGKYVIYTGDLGLTTAGKTFQIAGIDSGVIGPKTEATVKIKNNLVAPTIDKYYTTNVNVKGTVAGNAEKVAIFVDGVQKRTAAVLNSSYTIYTGDLGLTSAGMKFQVAVIDGTTVGPKTEMTVSEQGELLAPTINAYYSTNVNVTGTIDGSAEKVAIFIDGVQKRTAAVVNGSYIIYTGDLGLTSAGKKFEIAGIDGSNIGPKTIGVVL